YCLREDGVFMSREIGENEDEYLVYEYGFSKETSDAFTRKLITILRRKLSDNNVVKVETRKIGTSEEFTLTEKALILSFLQDTNDFVVSADQVRVNELSALLMGSSVESAKKAFQRAHQIRMGQLSSNEARAKLRNLQRILPVFHRLGYAETVKNIESRIKKVQEFIK